MGRMTSTNNGMAPGQDPMRGGTVPPVPAALSWPTRLPPVTSPMARKKAKVSRVPRPDFSVDTLRRQFVYPLKEAATNLGICEAALKRNCRRQNIKKWPYRQLHAILKKIEQSEDSLRSMKTNGNTYGTSSNASTDYHKVEMTLKDLRKQRDRIYDSNPPREKQQEPTSPHEDISQTLPLLGMPSVLGESITMHRSPSVTSSVLTSSSRSSELTREPEFSFAFPSRDDLCQDDPFWLQGELDPVMDISDGYLFDEAVVESFPTSKMFLDLDRSFGVLPDVDALFT